jgi:hypothetical protein
VSRRTATRVAWSAWTLALTLAFSALAFLVMNRTSPNAQSSDSLVADAVFAVAFLAFPTVGALIGSRRPANPIGWIFTVAGLLFGIAAFAGGYATHALFTDPGSLPAGREMAWLQSWLFLAPLFVTGLLLFLLFPDGRPPSRRWRPVLWLAGPAIVLVLLSEMLTLTELEGFPSVRNPFLIEGVAATVLQGAGNIAFILLLALTAASAISLVLRFRRARGVERQQIKWVAAASGFLALAFASGPGLFWWLPMGDGVWEPLVLLALASLPIAAGISILRYRLYEIDRIVNRTLVYGVLTAGLAGLYFGIVLGLQQIFSSFAGGSDLAIAGSTLAVAALFRPARRRMQALVDRRFYRRRYDARQTLDAFSARLREQIDLQALGSELSAVVQKTMEPAHVSLWILPAGEAMTPAVTISGRSPGTKEPR